MITLKCPRCGKEYKAFTEECPFCGFNPNKHTK